MNEEMECFSERRKMGLKVKMRKMQRGNGNVLYVAFAAFNGLMAKD